jgi:hypothetical protein
MQCFLATTEVGRLHNTFGVSETGSLILKSTQRYKPKLFSAVSLEFTEISHHRLDDSRTRFPAGLSLSTISRGLFFTQRW